MLTLFFLIIIIFIKRFQNKKLKKTPRVRATVGVKRGGWFHAHRPVALLGLEAQGVCTSRSPALPELARLFCVRLIWLQALFSSHFDRCEGAAMWLVGFVWEPYAETVATRFLLLVAFFFLSMRKSNFLIWGEGGQKNKKKKTLFIQNSLR